MKAVLLDWATMGPDLDITELYRLLPDLELYDDTEDDQIAARIAGAEIVLGNKVMISETLFSGAPAMRFIGLTATGTDNIDLDSAKRHGVAVANIRAYCTQSVAEHVFACLLNLAHNIGNYDRDVKNGEWQHAENFCMLTHRIDELSAMTLGIVGFGALGQGVARIAEAFNMDVIVSARPGSNSTPDDRVSFDELLQRADVISLHCPLNETTQNLFGTDEFLAMKSSAFLINTARGGLVDSQALATALQNGDIAAAAVDVLPKEPPVNGDPLIDYAGNNLIITPHIAWGTLQARQAAIDELTANIASFLEGGDRCRVV
ncbi:MAG: D-2-hydroxyacid dehydrogenase [Pseudomonadota bacterium]